MTLVKNQWGEVTMWAFGPVVCFHAWWTSPAGPWSNETIATVPAGLRPPHAVDFPMCRNNTLAGYGDVSFVVEADGAVRISAHGSTGHQGDYIATSGCWVAA